MARTQNKGDVSWSVPNRKRPIAYSTCATSHLVAALSTGERTIQDVRNLITYDVDAKRILDLYIEKGYGKILAKDFFR